MFLRERTLTRILCPPAREAESISQTGDTQLTESILNHIYIFTLFIKLSQKSDSSIKVFNYYISYSRPAESTYVTSHIRFVYLDQFSLTAKK